MGSQAHYGLLVDRRRQSYQAKELRITTMREVAMMDEAYLYDWFGVNAELLIDHAWGRESTAISDIKAYRTKSRSLSSGQVLMRDCHYEEGLIIAKEMMDPLCLDMAAKRIATDSVSLYSAGKRYCTGFF